MIVPSMVMTKTLYNPGLIYTVEIEEIQPRSDIFIGIE